MVSLSIHDLEFESVTSHRMLNEKEELTELQLRDITHSQFNESNVITSLLLPAIL